MDIINSTGQSLFFRFILDGFFILILLWVFRIIVPLIFRRQYLRQKVKHYLPLVDTLFWILFLAWFILRFSTSNPIFALILSAVLLGILFWISKFGLKDFVAGMILRLTSDYKRGDVLIAAGQEGKLKSWTLRALELESSKGEFIRLPYSKLMGDAIVKAKTGHKSATYSFRLVIKQKEDFTLLSAQISQYIFELPWSSVHQFPEVLIKDKQQEAIELQISCFPTDMAFAPKIEKKVIEKFAG